MRFEELYTSEIVDAITSALTTSEGTSPNIVYYVPTINSNMEHLVKPLNDNTNAYGICVRNSSIVRSNLTSIDFNTISFVVESVMKENNLQKFLDATEEVASDYDSLVYTITDNQTTYYVKPSFNIAYMSAPRYTISCGTQSVNVVNVSWLISVQFTLDQILVDKDTLKLTINATDTTIDNVIEYSASGNSNCTAFQKANENKITYNVLNYTNTMVITARATRSTTGSNKIFNDACFDASSLNGLTGVKVGTSSYSVKNFNVSKTWRDNTSVFQITLNW